jgi:hypothetical protein
MSSVSVSIPTSPPPPSVFQIDEILNKCLIKSVSILFNRNLPFSNILIESTPGEMELDYPAPPSEEEEEEWNPQKLLEKSILKLKLENLKKVIEINENKFEYFLSNNLKNNPNGISDFKKSIKNELREFDLKYKNKFNKDIPRNEKENFRPLYTLYKKLRDYIASRPVTNSPPEVVNVDDEKELEDLLNKKNEIRQILSEYQNKFMNENGRKIKYHRDIVPVDKQYREYKQIKEEIEKIEIKMGRKNSSKMSDRVDNLFI